MLDIGNDTHGGDLQGKIIVPEYLSNIENSGYGAPISPNAYSGINAIYDTKTQNKSFIFVQQQLELLGVTNNSFHLILLNPLLVGVDPYDENLTSMQVMMIIQECKLNMFYYLREVVRIEETGGKIVPFRMDRGTLAASFCFYNNINFYLMKPRQTGKTVGIVAMLSWAFKFSGPNSSFLFVNYKEELAKKNLRAMKNIISTLPKYIANAGTVDVDNTGKTVRKTDNIKTYSEPTSKNTAMVANSPTTEDAAEVVGRGYTQAYQYFDESEFIKYIDIIVKVSGMAFNTASTNAENNGSGYCRIFSTTPGDLGNEKTCARAMEIVNDCMVWSEDFYDEDITELKKKLIIKSNFRIIYIEYDYKQLGLGEDWFIKACSNVGNDVNKIRREILLQRFSGNSNSPFKPEDIEELTLNKKTPLFRKKVGKIYEILFYEKPKKKRFYFFGIDPSDGTGGDNYAITVTDPYTLQVVAEFRSSYMTAHGCCDLVNFMVDKYFPNSLIIVERNRNGGTVIEILKNSPLRNKIYSSPEANADNYRVRDKLDENGFIKEEFIRNKYFGTNTTPSTRTVMMNILMDAVQFAKSIVNTEYIVDDITKLIIKNDKIQAAPGKHDDSVMSWLLTLYIYYHGERLERYGFVRGEIPLDVEEDDRFKEARKLYSNPEIKRQFPTLYAYYQSELNKDKHIQEFNKEKNPSEFIERKIGGLAELSGSNTFDSNTIPELDDDEDVEIDGINKKQEKNWVHSVIKRFSSLNK